MLLWSLRGLFIVLIAAVAFSAVGDASDADDPTQLGQYRFLFMVIAILTTLVLIAVDAALPRKNLAALSGVFLGLVVGMVFAYGLGLVIDLLVEATARSLQGSSVVGAIKLMIGIVSCYLTISFVLQTKDDVRFVIPYVEFSKQARGNRPLLLDTSAIIDGRVADIVETKILDTELVVPRFVLLELQTIADSGDKLKRNRGRRGLDMLNKLQASPAIDVGISEQQVDEPGDVDQKLVALAKQIDGRIVTTDYNLNKIAQIRGVDVININDLTNALKPVVLPGETIDVRIVKPGEEHGQGIGYLEDGTMVVAEQSRDRINQQVTLAVTSVLQTSAGRMIFGRPESAAAGRKRSSEAELSDTSASGA